MLPYKLTFVSEVNHKNHDDDLGLEHPEEPNTEIKDFDVEQRIVVTVNSSFETPPLEEDSDGGFGLDMEVERIVSRRRVPSETESEIPPQFIQLGESPRAGELPFKNHHSYDATILTVTSPKNFYMTLLPWGALKKKTEMVVDAFYKTLTETCQDFGTTNHELLKPGLIVACHYKGLWRRAEILFACASVEEKENDVFKDFEYKVLFIDEGEEVQVTQSQLRYLTKNFLEHRRRVQKCSLFKPRGNWNSVAVARFNEIVVPESHVTLRVLRKHEEIWDVSIKMNLRGNSKFDSRNVDIGRALATFQRRERITAMHKPRLGSGHDADDEDSDSATKQVKNWETASSSACSKNNSSETSSSMDAPSTS